MKRLFVFIGIFLGLVLSFICLVTTLPINKARSFAFGGEIYNYDATLSTDGSNFGDYAIDGIQYLRYKGYPLIKYEIDLRNVSFGVPFALCDIVSNSINVRYLDNLHLNWGNSSLQNFCMLVLQDTYIDNTSNGIVYKCDEFSSGENLYYGSILLLGGLKYSVYFSTVAFTGNNELQLNENFGISKFIDRTLNNAFDYINDMSSETNYFLNFLNDNRFDDNADSNSLSTVFANSILENKLNTFYWGNDNYKQFSTVYNIYGSNLTNGNRTFFTNFNVNLQNFNVRNLTNYITNQSVTYQIKDFYFSIKKPSYRVNNTLIFYNFDYYNLLNRVNSVKYQLSKDGNFYNVNYNGNLPNSRYLYFNNDEINNTIFDEYIYLYLTFNNSNVVTIDSSGGYYLGFDFNFTFYNQPLVSNNGVYNYNFEKPSYVAMNWSLNPFHIPVLEAVENAVIFLVFYCPVISNILSYIHLDLFFGALINILNYFISGVVGQFVVACLSFIIFFAIMKSLLPMTIESGKAVYDGTQFAYNRREQKKEKALAKQQRQAEYYKNHKEKKRE